MARKVWPHRCGGRPEVHHLKRRSQGRDDSPANLVALCSVAHQWVTENPAAAHDLGLVQWSWE